MDCIPNFFILGYQKSHTTTLFNLMRQHPQIYLPQDKETYFFLDEDKYKKGIHYYLDYYMKNANKYLQRGEATPFYIVSEKVAYRLSKHFGSQLKFIVTMRNPIDRAYSSYWHSVRSGTEKLSFEDAIAREKQRIEEKQKSNWWKFAYVGNGMYAEHLNCYFKYFSQKNFLFLIDKDYRDMRAVCETVFNFLNVDTNVHIELNVQKNKSVKPRIQMLENLRLTNNPLRSLALVFLPRSIRRKIVTIYQKTNYKQFSYPAMKQETRCFLQQIFKKPNQNLEKILGYNLDTWQ